MSDSTFLNLLIDKDGLIKGPFGGDIKKSLFVPKSKSTYKVYEQGVVLNKDVNYGKYYLPSEYVESKLKRFLVEPGDILLTGAGTVGELFVVPKNAPKGIINQALLRIRLNKKIIRQDYFQYYFKHYIKSIISNINGDSVIPNLPPLPIIKLTKVVIPDLDVQGNISHILSLLDKKIELNNKINAELETMAKMIYNYWFVQFDFPDERGNPYKSSGGRMVWNDELKREIPEDFEVIPLSEILELNYSSLSSKSSDTTYSYLDTSNLTRNIMGDLSFIDSTQQKFPSRAKRIVHKDDILYSTVRPEQEHYGIIKHPVPNMLASTGFLQIRSRVDWISNDFIYQYLSQNSVRDHLNKIANISVSSYPSFSPNDLVALRLPVERRLIKAISTTLSQVYTLISNNQKEIRKLGHIRDWLLPMLMNGQVKVQEN